MIPKFFCKHPLPDKLTPLFEKKITKLKKIKSKHKVLEAAYKFTTKRYTGGKIETYVCFSDLWKTPLQIMQSTGYLHCTNLNLVMRILLIKSGKFKEEDTRLKYSFNYYVSPHQYLQVKTEKGWINTDPWGNKYGLQLGEYAVGFNN